MTNDNGPVRCCTETVIYCITLMKHDKLDLTIKDLTIHDPVIEVHQNIPSVPFNLNVYGSSNSGKTNCLLNLVSFYRKIFKDRIIVFASSRNGSLYSLEKNYGAKIYNSLIDETDGDVLDKLLKFQKGMKENGDKPKNVLIIFDDFITDSSFGKRRTIYDKLYSQGRHYQLSIICTSQQYTLLPSTIRRLGWYNIIFKISNNVEKKTMINEMCNTLEMNEFEFEKVYRECVVEPYSFIYIDTKNKSYSKRFGK